MGPQSPAYVPPQHRFVKRMTAMPEGPSRPPQIRCELLSWFRESAGPLAPAYEGAIRLLDDRGFPGRIHLIAHAVRDVCDRLIFVLDPQSEPHRVQYENEMDKIARDWPRLAGLRTGDDGQMPAEEFTIPYRVARSIDSLVDEHQTRRSRPSNSEMLFRHLMRKEPTQGQVNARVVKDFRSVRDWFMAWTHVRAENLTQVDEAELQNRFAAFERTLHSFVGGFFTTTKELDEILQQANQ